MSYIVSEDVLLPFYEVLDVGQKCPIISLFNERLNHEEEWIADGVC